MYIKREFSFLKKFHLLTNDNNNKKVFKLKKKTKREGNFGQYD